MVWCPTLCIRHRTRRLKACHLVLLNPLWKAFRSRVVAASQIMYSTSNNSSKYCTIKGVVRKTRCSQTRELCRKINAVSIWEINSTCHHKVPQIDELRHLYMMTFLQVCNIKNLLACIGPNQVHNPKMKHRWTASLMLSSNQQIGISWSSSIVQKAQSRRPQAEAGPAQVLVLVDRAVRVLEWFRSALSVPTVTRVESARWYKSH